MQNKSTKIKILAVLVLLFCLGALSLKFFNRVPERDTPQDFSIVSPANGKVIKIQEVLGERIEFFKGDVLQIVDASMGLGEYNVIVIEMNLKNVHTQRAPIGGKIIYQKHFAGEFRNAIFSKDKEYLANTNEKTLTVFEDDKGMRVGVVQVAGKMARRINSFKNVGDVVIKGEPYGNIELGSQVVLILPVDLNIQTKEGDILVDGESIITTK